MGGSQSYPGLTEDVMEDLTSLTYLSKGEILHLMKKFQSMDREKVTANYHHRFSKELIFDKFDVLKTNPFKDRLIRVFSSKDDECLSFEDLVDLYSAMSSECPCEVKAAWAFRVFDLDDDNQISTDDICGIIDRDTGADHLDEDEKRKIAQVILDDLKLSSTGSIGLCEFTIMMSRIPDFVSSFYFRL